MGIPGKLHRILTHDLVAEIYRVDWENLPIFSLIQKKGNIEEQVMYRVFNMGVGMIIISAPSNSERLLQDIPDTILIGEVMKQKGDRRVIIQGV